VTIATQITKAKPVPAKKYATQAQNPPPTAPPPRTLRKKVLLAFSLKPQDLHLTYAILFPLNYLTT
jgi:hypothetical protein